MTEVRIVKYKKKFSTSLWNVDTHLTGTFLEPQSSWFWDPQSTEQDKSVPIPTLPLSLSTFCLKRTTVKLCESLSSQGWCGAGHTIHAPALSRKKSSILKGWKSRKEVGGGRICPFPLLGLFLPNHVGFQPLAENRAALTFTLDRVFLIKSN